MAKSNVVRLHHANRDTSPSSHEERFAWDEEERGEATRPFRLWDCLNRKNLRWRYYADPKRAHMAALFEVRWLDVGASIEVYDCRTQKLLGQYTRRVDSIRFTEG